LILADTLRADRLGSYGSRQGLTPSLDELASGAVVFSNTYAASSWTLPSVASLFTSRYPSQHHVVTFPSMLAADEVTLATKLAALNYRAGGFSAHPSVVNAIGRRSFDTWPTYDGEPKTRADRVNRSALTWLDSVWNRSTQQPVFLYLHYMETHPLYAPPEPYLHRWQGPGDGPTLTAAAEQKFLKLRFADLTDQEVARLRFLYDGEVAALDAALRALFTELSGRGFLERCIVIVTADHGEEFREHGGMMHGLTLYNESIRVPLILKAPGYSQRVVAENVSLVDVAPTLFDVLGQPPEPRFEGRSLLPLLRGKSLGDGKILSQLPADDIGELRRAMGLEVTGDYRRHVEAFIAGQAKLLLSPAGTTEVYDLAHDQREAAPNTPVTPQTEVLLSALRKATAAFDDRAGLAAHGPPLDEAATERLRSLGYVGDDAGQGQGSR